MDHGRRDSHLQRAACHHSDDLSGAAGDFTFLYLEPGTYEVSIQKASFNKLVMKDIAVTVGTRAIIHPQLVVGRLDTVVSVIAATPLVDTAESALGTVVGQQTIDSLPTNGRNFTDFALLTSGATTDGGDGMISFNGISGNFNNYTVDGGNNNNAFFSQQIGRTSIPFQFSEDVIREFQVTRYLPLSLRPEPVCPHTYGLDWMSRYRRTIHVASARLAGGDAGIPALETKLWACSATAR